MWFFGVASAQAVAYPTGVSVERSCSASRGVARLATASRHGEKFPFTRAGRARPGAGLGYCVLGELEPDTVGGHVGDGADWNGDLMLAPEVSLLEKHVCDVVIGGVDDESLDAPD